MYGKHRDDPTTHHRSGFIVKRTHNGCEVFDPKDIVQPSSIADISLGYGREASFYEVRWYNRGRHFDPRNLGIDNRFTTKELAIAFVEKHGFGGYRIEGKKVRLR